MARTVKIPEEVIDIIRNEHSFTIASHINPDGDALGSSIALALAFRQLDKKVRIFNKDGVSAVYGFLPGQELVRKEIDPEELKLSVLFVIDCNGLDRIELKDILYRKAVVIDHHETLSDFGDIRWIEAESPATGLMVYYLLKELGITICPEIATNLYVAIAIDTGTFRYENTTPEVMRIAAELIDAGANPAMISLNLYESWSVKRFNLLIKTLNTLTIEKAGGLTVAITVITDDMFRETGTDASDTENFSNFPRVIRDVDISVMLRQAEPSLYKVSMRSKRGANVSVIASHFGGGGHRNAAGFRIRGGVEEIKLKILESIGRLKISA